MNAQEIELIQRAKHDSDAFQQLFELYKPIALRQIRLFNVESYTYDDWLQEAEYALFNAVLRYTANRGSQFGAYFQMVVRCHYISILRTNRAQKRLADAYAVHMGAAASELDEFMAGMRNACRFTEDNYVAQADIRELFTNLSRTEFRALATQFEGSDAMTPQLVRGLERVHSKMQKHFALR